MEQALRKSNQLHKFAEAALNSLRRALCKTDGECLDSFSLVNASKSVRAVRRDSYALFFVREASHLRKFKIKFAAGGAKESADVLCSRFMEVIRQHVPIIPNSSIDSSQGSSQLQFSQKGSSQLESQMVERCSSQIPADLKPLKLSGERIAAADSRRLIPVKNDAMVVSVKKVGEVVMSGDLSSLPEYYRNGSANVDGDDRSISDTIRACLLDPDFPKFVEAVEKEMMKLTSHS